MKQLVIDYMLSYIYVGTDVWIRGLSVKHS